LSVRCTRAALRRHEAARTEGYHYRGWKERAQEKPKIIFRAGS